MYGSRTVARCVNKVRDGASFATVAIDEGVSEKTIRAWCKNAGVRSPRSWWTYEEKQAAAKLWNDGCSYAQIGESMGKTVHSIRAFLRSNRDIAPYRYHKKK